MTSPYLDRTLLPLALVLTPMLEKIEADLAAAGPAETGRLRELLTPRQSPDPS